MIESNYETGKNVYHVWIGDLYDGYPYEGFIVAESEEEAHEIINMALYKGEPPTDAASELCRVVTYIGPLPFVSYYAPKKPLFTDGEWGSFMNYRDPF